MFKGGSVYNVQTVLGAYPKLKAYVHTYYEITDAHQVIYATPDETYQKY